MIYTIKNEKDFKKIPENTEEIKIELPVNYEVPAHAFSGKNFDKINLEGADTIWEEAFMDTQIEDANLENIVSIWANAFLFSKIRNISFGNKLKYIGVNTFKNTNVKHISIPESITLIDNCDYLFLPNINKINIK